MTKKAAVISDLSSFGRCSLTASIPILSVMGIQACPLPTAVLSAQSEFPVYFKKDLTEIMPEYRAAWAASNERFDGVCTGYFSSGRQIDEAIEVIRAFKKPDSVVLVDPVMGDNGCLYPGYDIEAREKMKLLTEHATVITPNLTELCILTGADYKELTNHEGEADYTEMIASTAAPLAENRDMIITGICAGDSVLNLALSDNECTVISSKRVGGSLSGFSGTGDIFSSVVMGCLLNGRSLIESAENAARFVEMSVRGTVNETYDPLYGVDFEKYLKYLTEVI